jgi:hypothetical protein
VTPLPSSHRPVPHTQRIIKRIHIVLETGGGSDVQHFKTCTDKTFMIGGKQAKEMEDRLL